MSLVFYKTIHVLGICLLFSGLGGAFLHSMNGGTKATNPSRLWLALSHGIGMALVIVGGFGALAKLGIEGIPAWIYVKIGLWLFLGLSLAMAFRKPKMAKPLWLLTCVIGMLAAYIALTKPF